MHIKNICTKDPTTCAFGTLAQITPPALIVLKLQHELIGRLFEFKSVQSQADHSEIYYLNQRFDSVVGKLNTWSKLHGEEQTQCPKHPKH